MSRLESNNTSLNLNTVSKTTLDGLFRARVTHTPELPAYRSFDKSSSQWRSFSWQETSQQVGRWQQAIQTEGLEKGDRVAVSLRNSPEWVHFEQAALGLGLVVIPLYADDRADNLAYILDVTDTRLLLIQDSGRWRRLAAALDAESLPQLKRIVTLEGDGAADEPRLRSATNWLPAEGCPPQGHNGDQEELATIVFTSGTTGRPKGVMLSHHNIISNTIASYDRAPLKSSDRLLSFLPLAHMYERIGGYYLAMLVGAEVCYARSIALLSRDLQEQQPTVLFSVPRIFERIEAKLQEQLSQASPLRRGLFKLAVEAGWRRFNFQQGNAGWHPLILLTPITQRLVGNKILALLGGRLNFVGAGGAPLSKSIARTFAGLGVPLFQGYGMTEASPIICGNKPGENDPFSIGPPLEGVEIKLGENDELLARGPNIMMGYWNNPSATAKTIDSEGWLHTGDQATIDNRGHVHITGRIKDIIVLSNGEKVPPADMEMAIAHHPLIEQVMVIGEGRSYLAGLVVLNPERWAELAESCSVEADDPASFKASSVTRAVQRIVTEQLAPFPGYAKVRRLYLTLEPWSVDNGMLTPTLKVKRPKVIERLADEIEALYENGAGN